MWSGVMVVVGRRDGGTDVYISQKGRFFCPGVGFEPSKGQLLSLIFNIVKMDKINPLNGRTCTLFYHFVLLVSDKIPKLIQSRLSKMGHPVQSTENPCHISLCLLPNLAEV